jgi:hypothetical protein
MVIDPNDGDEEVAHCVTQPCRPELQERLEGGEWPAVVAPRPTLVMSTAKIASENVFSRSGVALAWNTIVHLGV